MERNRRIALREKVTNVLSDGLFQDSSILVVATLVGGALNYAYQIAMGRLLGPEQYGVFGSLFALSYVLLIVSAGIGYVTTKYVSTLEGGRLAGFMRGIAVRVGVLTVVLFLGLAAASPWLASFLKIGDPFLVVVLGFAILLGPLNAVTRGSLRGLQEFVLMGGTGVGTALLKLLSGVALVVAGYGVYGAIGAIAVAQVVMFAAVLFYLRHWYLDEPEFDDFGPVYRYAVPSVLMAFCFNVPTNVDVMLVKHAFTSSQAGFYTSVSVFGKVLVFLPMGISNALFPKVSEGQSNGDRTMHLLGRALLYAGVVVAGAVVVLSVAPSFFVGLLFGAAYLPAAGLLPWYAAAIGVFSVCVVLLNYSLASDDLRFVKAFTVLTIAEIALVYMFSTSMLQVVQVLLAVNVVGAVLGLALFFGPLATNPAKRHAEGEE